MTKFIQKLTPNPHIPCQPGWCLQYVRQAFGLPGVHPTATAAWEASGTKHRDRNFPEGVWIAVWYGLVNEPAGHVVLRAPDGSVYSTSSLANTPYHHPNLAHLEAYYTRYGMTLTYRGWTEDVQGTRVITPIEEEDDELNKEQAGQLAYIASPAFKADLFAGTSAIEREARNKFAQELLGAEFPWFGFDGKPQPEGQRNSTSLMTAIGHGDAATIGIHGAIAGLKEIIEQLSIQQGVVIDYEKIAEAVADEQARRMKN